MKPRIFFVIYSLEGGGAERVISNLGNYFHQQGYLTTMVCLSAAKPVYKLAPGIRVVNLVERKDEENILNRLRYAFLTLTRFASLLIRERPECVVSFMTTVNLWTGFLCLMLRIPYIVSERTTPDYTVNRHKHLLKWFSFKIYSKSKAIVVPTEAMIKCFEKNSSYKGLENFRVIRNPINKFKTEAPQPVHSRKYVFSAGRLVKVKGFDILIEAFSMLQVNDVDLLISGEGPERDNLNRLIERYDLSSRVKLIGFKNNLLDHYRNAEVYVLSSRNEGYPNALVEALSMGCACIATNCEFGPSEIINHGENGLLVQPENSIQMAEAIDLVLTDPPLKEKLSQNSLKINESNSLENISAIWEKLILNDV